MNIIVVSNRGCNTRIASEYMDPKNQLFLRNDITGEMANVDETMERNLFLMLHAKRMNPKNENLTVFENTLYVVTGKRQIRRLFGIEDI